MFRLNAVLLIILTLCGFSVVTSQHQARRLFDTLQKQQQMTKQLENEWGELQLEQSTLATHARIEKTATQSLHMWMPDTQHIRIITPTGQALQIQTARHE